MYGYGGKHIVVVEATTPRSTSTLLQTGQTTVYRTGDDADTRAEGRATDFFTLDAAPLHNDGTATLNTTTARFTDTLGGSTYADDIVLDWSTWNGSTLLGYYKNIVAVNQTWNNAIDNALLVSVGSFTTGWRLPNANEMISLVNYSGTYALDYVPFSNTNSDIFWTSTTNPISSSQAFRVSNASFGLLIVAKTTGTGYRYMACRTFSLSTLNVLS